MRKLYRGRPDLIENCCKSEKIIKKESAYTCINCGTVHEQVIESTMERAYTKKEIAMRRHHEPFTPFGIATVVGRNRSDLRGLTPKEVYHAKRLYKTQRYYGNENGHAREKRVMICSENISNTFKIDFSKIRRNVKRLYRESTKKKIGMSGSSIEAFSAAYFVAACREVGTHITLKEVSSIFEENRHKERNIKNFKRAWQKLHMEGVIDEVNFLSSSERNIFRYGEKLGLPYEVQTESLKIFNGLKKNNFISGKDEDCVIAGVMYYVSKKRNADATQKRVAEVVGVTEASLRTYNNLLKNLNGKKS